MKSNWGVSGVRVTDISCARPAAERRIWTKGIQRREMPAQCPTPAADAFQASRFRDAFITSDNEQGVCRTLISLFLPPLTTRPLKPGEGRVWKLEKEESYSYKHAGFSSSAEDTLVDASM